MTISMPISEVVETESDAIQDQEDQIVEIEASDEPASQPIALSAQARERLTLLNRMLETSAVRNAEPSDSASEAECQSAEQ